MAAGGSGILIGDKLYSSIALTLENCLISEEKLSLTASVSDGLDPEVETDLRIVGCELIQAAGILLKLPQVAMATGQVLFQRFFYSKSFVKHPMEILSMACVHLASKIEEDPRRIRDVINVFHHLRKLREKKSPTPLPLDQSYVNLKNQVIKAERRVLKELGFCVHVKHPHKIIVMYLQVLECERNRPLVQTAWNYMNDSLRTDVFVRYHPETIACACIYLAARALEIPLPNRPHWFLLFGTSEEEMKEICVKILKLYTRKKANLEHLDSEVEKRKVALQEAKAKAKGLLPDGTPALDAPPSFSPSSKPDSPKDGKLEKPSPLSIQAMKNARRKLDEEEKWPRSNSPFNGVQKGKNSRSRSRSKGRSYSRSRSHSHSPRRRTRSRSASNSSRSRSHSRSRSDSPPQRHKRSSPYIGRPKVKEYDDMREYKYNSHKRRRSHSRSYSKSLSRSRSRSRERLDFPRKHKESRSHHRERRHDRSRSYERSSKHHNSHSGHSRHRR
ncbi:cyclin-L1-like isoform X2 [Chiloscyllium punctatum]|uniref:cyclin-L1-like isoform X2 n=1 Tax=Chiloscyllium punctatum TaxID=137246 RepID=UPI003B6366C2